ISMYFPGYAAVSFTLCIFLTFSILLVEDFIFVFKSSQLSLKCFKFIFFLGRTAICNFIHFFLHFITTTLGLYSDFAFGHTLL
ncbi:hypothetical protein L9F63_020387, partial [Diploptera punctata]